MRGEILCGINDELLLTVLDTLELAGNEKGDEDDEESGVDCLVDRLLLCVLAPQQTLKVTFICALLHLPPILLLSPAASPVEVVMK